MKVAITGHTQGLGQALFRHFNSYDVIGFSRNNGYNIADPISRSKILEQLVDVDIFINNAYNNYDDSQLQLLMGVYDLWKDLDRVIINISSRYTTGVEKYCKDKEQQDLFCKSKEFFLPHIINLKPGLFDTARVKNIQGKRLSVHDIIDIVDFALNSRCKIHTMSFGQR